MTEQADPWLGLLRLKLTVNCDNERGLALYRRCDFVVVGRHAADVFRDGE
jgi:RimJ/RimL family protein N-acetyltransferase